MSTRRSTSLQEQDEWWDEPHTRTRQRRKDTKHNLGSLRIKEASALKMEPWKISPEALADLAGISVETLSEWVGRGLLGKPDTRQRANSLSLGTAQKTILMSRLVAVGLHPVAAGHIVATHNSKDFGPLTVELPGGIVITVDRKNLGGS